MGKIEGIILCNVEESEFYPACLDCVKYPSRIYKCLENVEKKFGIKCCGLCENWVDPKPTEFEKLMGVCAENPDSGGVICYCKGCEDFKKRDTNELDEESFDLSELDSLPHSPGFDEDDEYEQGYLE